MTFISMVSSAATYTKYIRPSLMHHRSIHNNYSATEPSCFSISITRTNPGCWKNRVAATAAKNYRDE